MIQHKNLFRLTVILSFLLIGLLLISHQPSDAYQIVKLAQSQPLAPSQQLEAKTQPDSDSSIIPGQYIVVLNENPVTSRMSKRAIEQMVDSVVTTHVQAQPLHRYSSAIAGFAVKLTPSELKALEADPRVDRIEPDQMVTAATDQSNPPWGLDRIDQRNLPTDRNYNYDYDGSGVDVYVVDSGIRTTHTQFGGRVVGGYNAMGGSTLDYGDCNGHGTHVAGTIGGSLVGVAKNVNLYAVRVLGCQGSGSLSGIIDGIDWLTQNASGPSVANLSLGSPANSTVDQAVQNSINTGITYVFAAGNENQDACNVSPARVSAGITVNASTSQDQRASFSNYGTCTDIFAPGHQILSAWHTGDTDGNVISGTSMAAPHVAGVVALHLEANPTDSPAEVKQAILALATTGKITDVAGSPNRLLFSAVSKEAEPVPTATNTPTRRPTATSIPPTPLPTNTPTPLPTQPPSAGPTATPTLIPTATPSPQPTATINPVGGAPVIINPGTLSFVSGEIFEFSIDSYDPDGDYYFVEAFGFPSTVTFFGDSGFGYSFHDGSFDITLVATDVNGDSSESSFTLNIVNNTPNLGNTDFVYDDALSSNWTLDSFGNVIIDQNNSAPVSTGSKSIELNLNGNLDLVYFEPPADFDFGNYDYMEFDMRGVLPTQRVRFVALNAAFEELFFVELTLSDKEWRTVSFPLDEERRSAEEVEDDVVKYFGFRDMEYARVIYLDNFHFSDVVPGGPPPTGNLNERIYLPLIRR